MSNLYLLYTFYIPYILSYEIVSPLPSKHSALQETYRKYKLIVHVEYVHGLGCHDRDEIVSNNARSRMS